MLQGFISKLVGDLSSLTAENWLVFLLVMLFFIIESVVTLTWELLREQRFRSALIVDCKVYRNILLTNGFKADVVDKLLADKLVRDSLRDW